MRVGNAQHGPVTPSGLGFHSGPLLALVALLQLALALVMNPRWGTGLGAMMAAEPVTGREAAVPLALAQGVPPWWIAAASITQNLALAALIVPGAMAAVEATEKGTGAMARFLRRTHAAADKSRHRASSAWGLFAFMLIPFLANGPSIAGLLGRLIGVDARRLITAVVAAVIITATAWAYLYASLAVVLESIDPRLARIPSLLAILGTTIAVARLLWVWRREQVSS